MKLVKQILYLLDKICDTTEDYWCFCFRLFWKPYLYEKVISIKIIIMFVFSRSKAGAIIDEVKPRPVV